MDKMLSSFKSYLKESLVVDTMLLEAALSSAVAADDKGKLHELLLAKYLHPDKTLPLHHRAESENEEHSGTPQQVHDRLQRKIGDEAYAEIDKHAKDTAKAVLDHLEKTGETKKGETTIRNVHWTSNRDTDKSKGDHEKTTGVKDVNSNADLILTLADKEGKTVGYHGVSAKYGTNKQPNYKNPGTDTLEKMTGSEKGVINKMMASHHKDMEKLGYTGTVDDRHTKYKIDVMGAKKAIEEKKRLDKLVETGRKLSRKEVLMHQNLKDYVHAYNSVSDKEGFESDAQRRATMAEESGRAARARVAKHLSENLDKTSKASGNQDKHLRDMIAGHVSPKTVIPHTVAHSWVQDNGSSVPIVKNAEDIANDHLNKFEGLHVATDKAGGSITVKGYDVGTKKLTNVATYGLKSQSGPHKNINATMQLK